MPFIRPARAALALASLLNMSGCAGWRVDHAALAGTGFASHLLCDDVFVTGADPETAFAERVAPLTGAATPFMNRRIDRERREVTVSLAGGFESHARYSEDTGCTTLPASWSPGAPTSSKRCHPCRRPFISPRSGPSRPTTGCG